MIALAAVRARGGEGEEGVERGRALRSRLLLFVERRGVLRPGLLCVVMTTGEGGVSAVVLVGGVG